jgi:hypothetical protein
MPCNRVWRSAWIFFVYISLSLSLFCVSVSREIWSYYLARSPQSRDNISRRRRGAGWRGAGTPVRRTDAYRMSHVDRERSFRTRHVPRLQRAHCTPFNRWTGGPVTRWPGLRWNSNVAGWKISRRFIPNARHASVNRAESTIVFIIIIIISIKIMIKIVITMI